MKKTNLIYTLIALTALVCGVLASVRHESKVNAPAAAAPLSPATQFFALTLPDAGGQKQNLGRWKGKTLVINFWATWCPPCVEEMPALSALQSELTPKNAQILGIGIDSPSNIGQFFTKFKILYPVYVAGMEGTELARQFGNKAGGLPFTVLVGPDGQLKKTYSGKINLDELRKDLALP